LLARALILREGIGLAFLTSALLLRGAEASSSTNAVSFSKDIAPVLAAKCVTCHGPEKTKGRYRADSFAALMVPGQSKDAPIIAGQPGKSRLLALLTAKDPDDRMPQKDDPLPAKQIALIERWIQEGATFDGSDPKQSLVRSWARAPARSPKRMRAARPGACACLQSRRQELAAGAIMDHDLGSTTGKLLRRIKNVAQRIQALTFSPDGALLAAASGTPGRLGK
jgi:cytochrome c553